MIKKESKRRLSINNKSIVLFYSLSFFFFKFYIEPVSSLAQYDVQRNKQWQCIFIGILLHLLRTKEMCTEISMDFQVVK